MRTIQLENVRPSDAAQAILRLQGNPYSLARYPMFVDIFNSPYPRRLMRAGRQVSKTITMAADMVAEASLTAYLPIIYSNASGSQTKSFSTSKLDPFLMHSPIVYHNLIDRKNGINNVFTKRFRNYSEIRLVYFSDDGDRVRGNTAFRYYADEVQDVLYDALIDAEECTSAADHPRFVYAGTSKTMISTLEYLWASSTQKFWIIKCEGCNKWNIPSVDNIGQNGLICKKCERLLDTYKGIWYSMHTLETEPVIDGYHIPQIIMPMHCCNPEKWADILKKLKDYPEYKFLNEVMGIPVGEGDSPLTEAMLKEHCISSLKAVSPPLHGVRDGATYITAGIDWGGGGIQGVSRTVLSVYAVYPEEQRFTKIYGKIYSGGDPGKHIPEIAYHLRMFGANICYGDHGGGYYAMVQLAQLVPDIRIVPVKYAEQKIPFMWDERAGRFNVDRTTMIDNFISDYKRGRINTFCWEDFAPFAKDILNEKEDIIGEELGKPRRVWRHYPSKPDDSLHSMVFGWFACRVSCGMIDLRMSAQAHSIMLRIQC